MRFRLNIQETITVNIDGDVISSDNFVFYEDRIEWKIIDGVYGSIQLLSPNYFTRGQKNIKITGTFGYTEIPILVKKAAKLMIKNAVNPEIGELSRASQIKYEGLERMYIQQVWNGAGTGIIEADKLLANFYWANCRQQDLNRRSKINVSVL